MALRLGIPFCTVFLIGLLTACGGSDKVFGSSGVPDAGSDGPGAGGKSGTGGSATGGKGTTDGSATGGSTGDGSAGKDASSDAGDSGGEAGVVSGHSLGEPCKGSTGADACRAGLACTSGKCEFGHKTAVGAPCVASGECSTGLICALGVCAKAGTGVEGSGCRLDTDCATGLRCALVGFGAACAPEGTADVGQTCAVSSDCVGGLLCKPAASGGPTCAPIPATGTGAGVPFGIPTPPPSLGCAAPSTGRVDAHFEVPGAQGTSATGDFFRLPFPNDARIEGGKINLDGFPTPGSTFLGYDPVKVYVDAIVAKESAWGPYPTVMFRFSGALNFDSLRVVSGQPSPVQFLDITNPASPGNGGAEWSYSGASGKYVCHNWVGVRRPPGAPLEAGHVYTVYVSTAARDANGLAINRSSQLAALLAASAPADAGLANAYAAYKPLRDYLTAQTVDPNTILSATVFTVGPVRSHMAALAGATQTVPVPTTTTPGWVRCTTGTISPCPDATGSRACGAASADYDEYHALVTLPIFQKGAAPYLTSGGEIDTTGPVRNEDVCVALTVPKSTKPAAGWPVVVFGHGTGGSFRSHIRPEVSGALAKASAPMAVLGFDEVQHGPRRGTSTASPNVLFFNFGNPDAARGNPLQGAADVITIGRFARTISIPGTVTGGAAVSVNTSALLYFGHSQGALHGSLALPYAGAYTAAVLSGNGASIAHALLEKTSPDNVAAAVPLVLGGDFEGGGKLFGQETHPVLTLLDHWIGPADPLNFARSIARSPIAPAKAKSVFQPYGVGDTYSPPLTMEMFALAAGLQVAAHDPSVTTPDAIGGLAERPLPLTANFATGGTTVTIALREYRNASGKDGHFVVFDVPSANADAVRFLAGAAAGSDPVVGQ